MPAVAAPSPLTELSSSAKARIIEQAISNLIGVEVVVTIDRVTYGRIFPMRSGTEPATISARIGEGAKPITELAIERLQDVPDSTLAEALNRHFSEVVGTPTSCSITRIAFFPHKPGGSVRLEFRVEPMA